MHNFLHQGKNVKYGSDAGYGDIFDEVDAVLRYVRDTALSYLAGEHDNLDAMLSRFPHLAKKVRRIENFPLLIKKFPLLKYTCK